LIKSLNNQVKNILIILIGLVIVSLSAKIKIPIPPVPVTLQTMFVLIFSMAVGARLSFITFGTYLILGSLGLPIFANPPYGGPVYMIGPSGGYLIGMLLSSYIVGYLAEINFYKNYIRSIIAILTGTIIIFLFGIVWLGIWFNYFSSLANEINFVESYNKAFENGLFVFMYTEPIKIAVSASIIPLLWKIKN